ncbi:hypothetical protein H2200_009746 [Cladophialophora chaetospira]|uniref:Uncharacterized protein n=1 Tax=Cladophialophora chaetospira TaxID=386627 RepID=A0AA38X3C2_9EURO|nr:hypothetical protein H2200_009746 [Cladophialophora chaetospira]
MAGLRTLQLSGDLESLLNELPPIQSLIYLRLVSTQHRKTIGIDLMLAALERQSTIVRLQLDDINICNGLRPPRSPTESESEGWDAEGEVDVPVSAGSHGNVGLEALSCFGIEIDEAALGKVLSKLVRLKVLTIERASDGDLIDIEFSGGFHVPTKHLSAALAQAAASLEQLSFVPIFDIYESIEDISLFESLRHFSSLRDLVIYPELLIGRMSCPNWIIVTEPQPCHVLATKLPSSLETLTLAINLVQADRRGVAY